MITLFPFRDEFPGYKIKFAPNGRRYVIGINGLLITDLKIGEVSNINIAGIQNFDWSPDGTRLVFSTANCGEQWVETSSVYIWDTSTEKSKMLFTTNQILLRPEEWENNATIRIIGEQLVNPNSPLLIISLYTIYQYDTSQDNIIFTGTATPYP